MAHKALPEWEGEFSMAAPSLRQNSAWSPDFPLKSQWKPPFFYGLAFCRSVELSWDGYHQRLLYVLFRAARWSAPGATWVTAKWPRIAVPERRDRVLRWFWAVSPWRLSCMLTQNHSALLKLCACGGRVSGEDLWNAFRVFSHYLHNPFYVLISLGSNCYLTMGIKFQQLAFGRYSQIISNQRHHYQNLLQV
jgi:hypothetical protein